MKRYYWFEFAVQGPRNLTCVGGHFGTVNEALKAAPAANAERAKDGRKSIVAIKKVYHGGRSEFARWVSGDNSDERDEAPLVKPEPKRVDCDGWSI